MTTLTLTPVRDLALATGGRSNALQLHIQAPGADAGRERDPVQVAFAIDCSGSMAGVKLRLVGEAVARALDQLRPADRFAIVVFGSEAQVLVAARYATSDAVRDAQARVLALRAGSNTHLSGGWLAACAELGVRLPGDGAAPSGVKRALLLTDGEANQGITDTEALLGYAARIRAGGVTTTTFGVGESFNEGLLGPMADVGGGNFYFIANPASIPVHIGAELGATVHITARSVRVRLALPPGASVRVLAPYPLTATDEGVEVQLPDLFNHQQIELPLLVALPGGAAGAPASVRVTLLAEGQPPVEAQHAWTYASAAAVSAARTDHEVALAITQRIASVARSAALLHNRAGAFDKVHALMAAAMVDITDVLGDSPLGMSLAQGALHELQRDGARYSRPMQELQRKQDYFEFSSDIRSMKTSPSELLAGLELMERHRRRDPSS